ncbi:MAG: hypothetical protein CVU97_00790 [Firmicutes bacterium HGW-Firmicutes-21]|nr:MAG: hypothetical protein CVU97_00790 [Firmicutes bacterium HGW-Firmicutes-21]
MKSNKSILKSDTQQFNRYKFKQTATSLILIGILCFSALLTGCDVLSSDSYMTANYKINTEGIKNTEDGTLIENPIIKVEDESISTFSIDVDTASYVNFRRYIANMSLKKFQEEKYSIRTEEAINYFNYNYKKPAGDEIIAVNTMIGDCPWNTEAKLAVITLAGKELVAAEQAGSNIVFLVDVSGSMNSPERLPLLKESLTMAIEKLNEKDIVSIVTYASGVNTIISGVSATEKEKIIKALDALKPGGSTAGASGLNLAYSVAEDHFIKDGNNRIVLATDGDFNVGPSSVEEIKSIVTQKRQSGIFLTVLGFGVSYQSGDSRLEALADNGNGGYFVIDSILEGEKVLCEQFTSTLYTIAKDVKVQVEFNVNTVESYRLIGYENRLLSNEDFEDDSVDAGDMGAGHTVTAMYELILKGDITDELFAVKVRYKEPNSDESFLYEHTAQVNTSLPNDFYFAAAVAEACLVINDSKYKGSATLKKAYEAASEYSNGDIYRQNFVEILKNLVE